MAKQLISNVEVEGVWYGPDYPDNKASAEVLDKITNPAAFDADAAPASFVDLRFRADDFGEEDAPSLRTDAAQPDKAAPASKARKSE